MVGVRPAMWSEVEALIAIELQKTARAIIS
jgi:hypothetical protein